MCVSACFNLKTEQFPTCLQASFEDYSFKKLRNSYSAETKLGSFLPADSAAVTSSLVIGYYFKQMSTADRFSCLLIQRFCSESAYLIYP